MVHTHAIFFKPAVFKESHGLKQECLKNFIVKTNKKQAANHPDLSVNMCTLLRRGPHFYSVLSKPKCGMNTRIVLLTQ